MSLYMTFFKIEVHFPKIYSSHAYILHLHETLPEFDQFKLCRQSFRTFCAINSDDILFLI